MIVADLKDVTLCVSGVLTRSPFSKTVHPTKMRVPQSLTEQDFQTLTMLGSDNASPVLLNYAQHYAIIADLVDRARIHMGHIDIVIRFSATFNMPLPECLLSPGVFLVDRPERWVRMIDPRRSLLVIDDRFRRDTIERGDNRFVCSTRHVSRPKAVSWIESSFIFPFLDAVSCDTRSDR